MLLLIGDAPQAIAGCIPHERTDGGSIAALAGSTLMAQETPTTPKETPAKRHVGEHAFRASHVIGMTIKNAEGKDLGTVNDFVVDMKNGQIRYLAVSYGGWLGLGDKLFAVPREKFEVRRFADSDKHYLVLDVSEEKLKKAKGFDQDNWPEFATDAQWQPKSDTAGKETEGTRK